MKIRGVTFSDENMTRSAMLCRDSMLRNGVDECNIWSPQDIDEVFAKMNTKILSAPRGCGYWLWKPYVIYRTMMGANDGDIICYSDAGVEFIGHVQPIIDAMKDEDILLFSNGWPHIEWCKANVMLRINNWHVLDAFKEVKQVQASNIFIRVNDKTNSFVKEWLLWCQMPGLIDDSPSTIPNYPTFADHRHDQAILCCIAEKYGIKRHWFPTTTNQHQKQEGDNYPTIFFHHRKRNHEW